MSSPIPFPTTGNNRVIVYCLSCGNKTWTMSELIEARFGCLPFGMLTGKLRCKTGCGDNFGVVLPLDAPDPRAWVKKYGVVPPALPDKKRTRVVAPAFADAFKDGQRGIVLVKTFNEAPDVEGPPVQHTITPGDAEAIGIAFIWRRFEIADIPVPMLACVMCTVPANQLIATLPTDRMPAVLAADDWAIWLGEEAADLDRVKACLRTVEGVKWTMSKEERKADPKVKRRPPTVSDPGGLI